MFFFCNVSTIHKLVYWTNRYICLYLYGFINQFINNGAVAFHRTCVFNTAPWTSSCWYEGRNTFKRTPDVSLWYSQLTSADVIYPKYIWLVVSNIFSHNIWDNPSHKVLARGPPRFVFRWGWFLSRHSLSGIPKRLPRVLIWTFVFRSLTAIYFADWRAWTSTSAWIASWISTWSICFLLSFWHLESQLHKKPGFCTCSALIWVHHLSGLLQCA